MTTKDKKTPAVGTPVMALHPSINGTWQMSIIVEHPSNPEVVLVQFPDGTRYESKDVQYNAIAQPTAEPEQTTAVTSPLDDNYQEFRLRLSGLNRDSKVMFGVPLGVLLVMSDRLAASTEAEASGHYGNYEGIKMFVPNDATFDAWLEDYLFNVQERSKGQSPE